MSTTTTAPPKPTNRRPQRTAAAEATTSSFSNDDLDQAARERSICGSGGSVFDALPVETIHHVFSFVPARHLAQTCALVARWWAEIIDDASLWRALATRDFHLRVNSLASRSHRQLAWKLEYRDLLERWRAIKKMQLAADNIDTTLVRLQSVPAEDGYDDDKSNDGDENDDENGEMREAPQENNGLMLLRAAYLGTRTGAGNEGDNVGATQPLTPFPTNNGCVGYFEVRIDSTGTSGLIGVGLAKKDYPKRKAQPGWRQSSYGWHGDDGRLYEPGLPIGRAWAGCSTWVKGDIVGCGIDYNTNDVFFTLNGQYLGAEVTLNFGGEPLRQFAYDLGAYPHVGPGFVGCLTPPVALESGADDDDDDDEGDDESEEGALRQHIKFLEMMLSMLANREPSAPLAELKSDVDSVAYMLGVSEALAGSELELEEKREYLERMCENALVTFRFQLDLVNGDDGGVYDPDDEEED